MTHTFNSRERRKDLVGKTTAAEDHKIFIDAMERFLKVRVNFMSDAVIPQLLVLVVIISDCDFP